MTTTQTTTTLRLSALLASAALTLTGCAAAAEPTADIASAQSASEIVTIDDAWVKAAESGMSAAFGTVRNDGDEDVTVEAAASPASSKLELHETVENEAGQMIMREIEGGFVIPAGGSLELSPGGNHIMLLDLTAPLEAGEEQIFTLTFADGSELEFDAPVKDYEGANETYESGDMDMDMGGEG